jgi:hypothetical protein
MESLTVLLNPKLNFSYENSIQFKPLTIDVLPFPMNLSMEWRIIIAITLLITLVEGAKLRIVIFQFINSPDSNIGPINILIWVDQINGIALAITIFSRTLSLILPFPTSSLLGEKFCNLILYVSGHYIIGSYTWGCCIAFFRVLFIKAQVWLNQTIGIRNMLYFMLIYGSTVMVTLSTMLFLYDYTSTYRMCTHTSTEDTTIMAEYMVIITILFYINAIRLLNSSFEQHKAMTFIFFVF